jgi:signal transduction histidine kinase
VERLNPVFPKPIGIALLCDSEGRILEIVDDQLGLTVRFPTGRIFSSCLASGSLAKSLDFLQEIRERHAAFEWELQVDTENGQVLTLCFDGCIVDGRLLILGAASSQELLGFLDDLMRIQNEQIKGLRLLLKALSLKEAAAGRFPHDLYNELTRLNNDLANAQRDLVKQNFELERLGRLKTQFLGMAAHDLRTPIGHILSYSDFLREDAAAVLTGEQLEFLSVIRSSSEFMLQLIDDFLDVSSIESGNLRLDRCPLDLRKLLEHNVLLNAVLAQKKSIEVSLQIEGALPTLSLDEGKIRQVLNNLISNAVKFSQPGTVVTVQAMAEGGGVQISVRDQGPGIPEGERDKLFQPFGKTSIRSTAGESSTGLGLAIVRRIVEGHGGRIWVESKVGVGSVFFLTLPA